MTPRLDFPEVDPQAFQAMLGLEAHVRRSGLDKRMLELVKIRTSQLNRCAYCIDMHTKDARADGETEQRIYALSAWRETPFFEAHERAALAWAESVTLLAENDVPDALYATTIEFFDESQLAALTLAVVAINGWNRLCVAFRAVPGVYSAPGGKTSAEATTNSPGAPGQT